MSGIVALFVWIGLSFPVAVLIGRIIRGPGEFDEMWHDFEEALGSRAPDDVVDVKRGPYDWQRTGEL